MADYLSVAKIHWKPTPENTKPLKGEELKKHLEHIGSNWASNKDELLLEKEYTFPNFTKALEFTNKIGVLADELDHHPDIHLSWGKCKIKIWTHTINGIVINDFIYAARAEKIFQENFKE